MRRFELHRHSDVTGVSGPGLVAEGVSFGDGATVIRWRGEYASTVVWPSIEAAIHVHGHVGNTAFRWLDDEGQAVAELDPAAVWVIPKQPIESEAWVPKTRSGWYVESYGLQGDDFEFGGTSEDARELAARYLAAADEADRRNAGEREADRG